MRRLAAAALVPARAKKAAKAKGPTKPAKSKPAVEAAKKPAAKAKRPRPAPSAQVVVTKRTKPAPAPAVAPPKEAPAKKPKPARNGPVERTRVVFPKEVYEPRKEDIKAPLKQHGLKWQYLGEGKGRYSKEGVNLFAQFLDDGTHYSIWGDDKGTVEAIKDSWRQLLGDEAWARATARGTEAVEKEKQEQQSEAMRIWQLGEPQQQKGEPETFYQRRRNEWLARKPSA